MLTIVKRGSYYPALIKVSLIDTSLAVPAISFRSGKLLSFPPSLVIPAHAGIQSFPGAPWIPARTRYARLAGMTMK